MLLALLLAASLAHEEAFEKAERLLQADPADVEAAYDALKLAEAKNDPGLVREWARRAAAAARRALPTPWNTEAGARRYDIAVQVVTYVEYLDYREILVTADRSRQIALSERFLASTPRSPYASKVERLELDSLRQIDAGKAIAFAERLIERDRADEEALLLVAESYARQDREPERVIAYTSKALLIMESGPQGDSRLRSAALFYLGWANDKIGKVVEAIQFTRECASLAGPFQAQAARRLAEY